MATPKDPITDFGLILRNLRVNLGITVVNVARGIGKSQSYVTQVERGMSSAPKRDTLRKWLKTLHCEERFEELNSLALINRTSLHARLTPLDPSNADLARIIDAYKADSLTEADRLALSIIARG